MKQQQINSYSEFKSIVANSRLKRADYYINLIRFRQELIKDIDDNGQTVVAVELGTTQSRLSQIIQILKYLDRDEVLEYLCPSS